MDNCSLQDLKQHEETFDNVMALYAALRDSNAIRVKRAEMRQGGVQAEAIDFVCDVEIKAGRVLGSYLELRDRSYFIWREIIEVPERYVFAPPDLKQELGKVFTENNLGPGGDYAALFFRIKNNQTRKAMKATEEQ